MNPKKLIILAVAVLLLLGGGGVAVSKILHHGGKAKNSQKHHKHSDETDDSAKNSDDSSSDSDSADNSDGDSDKSDGGDAEKTTPVKLDEFVVNLADEDEQHYLKVEITLEMKGAAQGEDPFKEAMPKIRDAILGILCNKHYTDVLPTKGKLALKEEIKKAVNKALGGKKIAHVYFTAFAMQ